MYSSILALLALVGMINAEPGDNPTSNFDVITAPQSGDILPAGEPFSIQWELGSHIDGTVTIKLFGGIIGPLINFHAINTIGKGIENDKRSYSWTPNKADDPNLAYLLNITLDSDNSVYQLSEKFKIITEPDDVPATTTESTQTGYTSSQAAVTTALMTTSTGSLQDFSSTSRDNTIGSLSTTTSLSGSSSTMASSSSPSSTNAAERIGTDMFAMIGGLALVIIAH
ncbi:hypothetical protein E8E14_000221 [Neopestalotiopsis sp. 37M]|nr:hypothetical protein E8E14_000221 [Neopestalotiopsis sp. 37M]